MKKLFVLLLLLVLLHPAYGQLVPPTIVKKVPVLEIVNKDLEVILDSIITIENQRRSSEKKTHFVISSFGSGDTITITTVFRIWNTSKYLGVFKYNDETIIVDYDLKERLVKETGKYQRLDLLIDGLWTDPKTGKKVEVIHALWHSPSWMYTYDDEGRLVLVSLYKFSDKQQTRLPQ